jgi:nitrogen fixation NifU-like protein
MNLDTLYQEIILDHYRRPHLKGLREPFDAEVHHVNPTCGDEVTLRVRLAPGNGAPLVEDVSYDSMGCSISQASVSVMTDLVVGRTLDEATRAYDAFLALMRTKGDTSGLGDDAEELLEDAVAFEGVSKYPARIKCALLGWMAWKDAVTRAADGHGEPHETTEETP